jgi:hypothetical protein
MRRPLLVRQAAEQRYAFGQFNLGQDCAARPVLQDYLAATASNILAKSKRMTPRQLADERMSREWKPKEKV